MCQTEEIRMMSRPNRFTYTPITKGHKPAASEKIRSFVKYEGFCRNMRDFDEI